MSRMIPQQIVDALRQQVDISVDLYGIDCTLYIPTNLNTTELLDVYATPADVTYEEYSTQVWIEWSQNKHKLRRLGLYFEDDVPIVAWFKNKIDGNFVDIPIGSYFRVSTQFTPDNVDSDAFDLVEVVLPNMHDAEITKFFKIAPRRVK